MNFLNKIITVFKQNDIEIDQEKAEQFELFMNILIETNKVINLTSITEPDEIISKHFVDSCIPHFLFAENSNLCDVGSGAGFPAIPLKILRPDLKITMIDSLQKRIEFLQKVISALNLKNINAQHTRAQEFCAKNREIFDYTTARAVASLNVLSELCLPLTKLNGKFIAYKSQNIQTELCKAEFAIKELGGKIEDMYSKDLIDNETKLTRFFVVINKETETPIKYPRLKNKIEKQPL